MGAKVDASKFSLMDWWGQDTEELGNLTATLQRIADAAHSLFQADVVIIFAINPITHEALWPPTVTGSLRGKSLEIYKGPRDDGVTKAVLEQGLIYVADLAQYPDYFSPFAKEEGVQAFMVGALRTHRQQEPLAALYVDYRQPRSFETETQMQFRIFIQQASTILQNNWLLRRYQEVRRIGQEVNLGLPSVEALFHHLNSHLLSIVDATHFFMLALYHPHQQTFDGYYSCAGQFGLLPALPPDEITRLVLERQRSELVRDLSLEPQWLEVLPPYLEEVAGLTPASFIVVPLVFKELPLGVLSLYHLRASAYDAEDLQLLELLGNSLALALHNLNLFANLRALNETGQEIMRELDSGRGLGNAVQAVQRATQAESVILYLYDAESQEVLFPPYLSPSTVHPGLFNADSFSPEEIRALVSYPPDPILFTDPVDIKSLYRDNDLSSVPPRWPDFASLVAVPLHVAEEGVGVLLLTYRQTYRFDESLRQLIVGLAHFVALAIKTVRAFGVRSQYYSRSLEMLQTVLGRLSVEEELNIPDLMRTILELVTQQIPVHQASILLHETTPDEEGYLVPIAAVGAYQPESLRHRISLQEAQGITRWVFEHRRPARISDVYVDLPWKDIYIPIPGTEQIHSELDVPLLDGEQVLGIINFEHHTQGAFSHEDELLLVNLASQAVLALKIAQAYQRAQRVARERQVLIEIDQELTGQLDPKEVLNLILTKALEITHCPTGNLMRYDPQRNDLEMVAEQGVDEDKRGARQRMGQGIVGWVALHKKPLNVDVTVSPWRERYLGFISNIRSELAVPLLEGETLRGVLNLESPHANFFSPEDERLLLALANLAVIALQNAERYTRAEERRKQLQALHVLDKKIISQVADVDQVMRMIVRYALELTGAEIADLDLYEDGRVVTTYFTPMHGSGGGEGLQRTDYDDGSAPPPKRGIMRHVAQTRQAYRTLHDAQHDPYYVGEADIHSEIAVPLLSDSGELIGILNIDSRREYAFDEDDQEILERFASQAVIAIQNVRHYTQAESAGLRFQRLYRAGVLLGQVTTAAQAYDRLLEIAVEHHPGQVAIRRFDSISQELELVRAYPSQAGLFERMGIQEGLNGQVAQEKQTKLVNDIANLPLDVISVKPSNPQTRALLVTPIQLASHYYGNLGFSHEQAGYFKEEDKTLIEGLATQLAITLHRLESVQAQQEVEKRLKEAEVMNSIAQLALELGHRLGNDLGLVRSYGHEINAALVEAGVDAGLIAEPLDAILQRVGRVLDLSARLKEDLTGFGKGSRDQKSVPVPLQMLMQDAQQLFPAIPPSVQLVIEPVPPQLKVQVVPRHVSDILYNLVTNAIAAMPDGGNLTIRTREQPHHALVEVSDTGHGIPTDRQGRIFDLFYTSKREGFGFGLWSSRRNALANGGDLTVTSEVGRGSTFTLLLPKP